MKNNKSEKAYQYDLFGSKVEIVKKRILKEVFIVPPFSVLDTKQGYWQDRKRKWLSLIGNIEESREGTLFGGKNFSEKQHSDVMKRILKLGTTSKFDPVLTEVIYKWFNIEGGKILDPFGGEQTKGLVAGVLSYPYEAVEFRKEQVEVNKETCKEYKEVAYYCGDSVNLSSIIQNKDFDLCFTSPPYYDLEIYSKEDASALGTYADFLIFYKKVFEQVFDMLKPNRFLVLKVGEVRDKQTGEYRNFVGDNTRIMKEIGFKYYNEIVLLQAIGTAPLRTQFGRNRKNTKVHQNILVFYKGDLSKIKEIFGEKNDKM